MKERRKRILAFMLAVMIACQVIPLPVLETHAEAQPRILFDLKADGM